MTDAPRLYTAAEAGAVSGMKLKAVHNAIDKHIVEPVAGSRAGAVQPTRRSGTRLLTGDDLLRLRLWRGVGENLSAERGRRLFVAIAAEPEARTVKAGDLLIIDVAEARKQVDQGVRDLEAAEAVVVRDPAILGGETMFKGTRIPVHGVAAMLEGGAGAEDILSGYPKLTRRMLELARIWVAAHPRRGRPKSLGDLGLTIKSTRRAPLKADPLAGRATAAAPAIG